jgi:hypothetical protein
MKCRKGEVSVAEIAKQALAEPYSPGTIKRQSYLEDWINPARRGGMLRRLSESSFVGSLRDHSVEDMETFFQQFIVDARSIGVEKASDRLYSRLMPSVLTNGGPPFED